MALKKGQQLELEIERIAFGGKGVVRVDGLVVFVDGAVPQDHVLVRITKKRKNYAEARVLEIIEPSPQRVKAPCQYSGICGGCKWQFLDYQHQLLYKQQHVSEALSHIALIEGVTVHPTLANDKLYGYRNKMEFSCAERRWLLPEEMDNEIVEAGMALGLHVPGTFHKVLDIEKCLLQSDQGNQILDEVRQFIKDSPLPVYGLRSHEGFWRFLVLRHSTAYDQWMVNVVTAADQRNHVQPLAERLLQQFPNIRSVINNIHSGKAGVAVGQYEVTLAGEPFIIERIGSFEFELSANSFFQTNTEGAKRLYDTVRKFARLTGEERVLDLYCGTGTISIFLASASKEVVGLEVVETAVEDARRNCKRNGVDNCRFLSGDIRLTLPQLEAEPDVMIIDPPRAGMHEDVVKEVMALGPRRIVYVSCNPATMARDLILLKEVYSVKEVQPVDMFPHTYHIEAVARLEKK